MFSWWLWGRLYVIVVTYVDTHKKYVDIKLILHICQIYCAFDIFQKVEFGLAPYTEKVNFLNFVMI